MSKKRTLRTVATLGASSMKLGPKRSDLIVGTERARSEKLSQWRLASRLARRFISPCGIQRTPTTSGVLGLDR